MRKFVCVLLAITLVASFVVPCSAATDDNAIMPRYMYFELLTVGFSIDENSGVSSSRATSFSVDGYTNKIVCKLQRERTNGWTTLKTWTATGIGYAEIDQDWAVYSGYNYRIVVTFSVLDSDGTVLETLTKARYYDYT